MPHPSLTPTTLLGFDFGMRHIGVAIGQTTTHTARALTTLRARDGIPDWQVIHQLIAEWQAQALVVGLPIDMKETLTESSKAAQRFANRLKEQTKLPVYMVDEKLSSREARQQLAEQGEKLDKSAVDAKAAEIILQTWLNSLLV